MKPIDEKLRPSALLGRLLIVYGLVVLWVVFLLSRLVYLQVYQSDSYREQAKKQQHGFKLLQGKRGEILDRNLKELAISVQLHSLRAESRLIKNPRAAAEALSPILSVPVQEIMARLRSKRRSVLLERKVVPWQAERIRQLDITGVFLHQERRRFYPDFQLAAHVLGFVGRDGEGLSGLEYKWDKQIRGHQDRVRLRVDARRKSFSSEAEDQPRDGSTLVLNLHSSIQYLAESTLERTVLQNEASDGSIVVMDPHRGEILAMASFPRFDPNRFAEFDEENYRNRTILQVFEPGSTMKIISLAAVLQEGLVDLNEMVDCRAGTLRLAGKVYREASHSFDQLSFNEILAKSSNIGTIKLVLRLGPEKLYQYLQTFGFGEKTGVDLPGEEAGLLRPPSQWSKISIGALAIGQELAATPLQVLRAVASIANGGYLVKPYVVRRTLNADGELEEFSPERRRVLLPETAELMKHALAEVVTEGTGREAAL
ncbi:MAG: peptidoglycan D,D-transpeptidase FtsI family protein, partial [Acidobacteriota bacterium]